MSQIREEDADRIVQSQMPGYRVVKSQGSFDDSFADSGVQAESDVQAPNVSELHGGTMAATDNSRTPTVAEQEPDLENLYNKFLGKSRSDFVDTKNSPPETKKEGRTSIVTVAPEQPSSDDPIDQSLRRRNVVINPDTEEIEGFSG